MAGEEVRKETIEVLHALRSAGVRVDRDLKERPLRKQMEYAPSIKARLVVIVGPREIKENKIRLRDMKTGEEKDVQMDSIVNEVRKALV
jgi:histidyl-tRNA synthetase